MTYKSNISKPKKGVTATAGGSREANQYRDTGSMARQTAAAAASSMPPCSRPHPSQLPGSPHTPGLPAAALGYHMHAGLLLVPPCMARMSTISKAKHGYANTCVATGKEQAGKVVWQPEW